LRDIAKRVKLVVLDFDGVITDNRVFVLQDGTEGVVCSRADGLGLDILKKRGIQILVISAEKNPIVKVRCEKLKIDCVYGCEKKDKILRYEAKKRKIPLCEVAYIGNDINDIECLSKVGLPVCVADAHPKVKKIAAFKTKAKGGNGAVREFCEFLCKQ
jgi:YrbI family 3-deoxy-D-manno-octulosonate 8-phosphate phosphatase